ncbi:hypothetical protein MNEG_4231 [Monoraphidium neglectum]|uniref:Uncharacterized protein n=1 Tax=Monoraphidium neglectum TaxID=145388 RepID=A0A0D2NEZ6_9CHLO|nr:hypothetical protein MNEG_4231 [Monoraphidium neglectum]KIZ03726.1 hypothetical protein MNEG_4231 [Monoraphidium neglectum]|eukprot:XP_013902745.1 hypothetical protein MNEG_4231 [Monoraphidium neglectum]
MEGVAFARRPASHRRSHSFSGTWQPAPEGGAPLPSPSCNEQLLGAPVDAAAQRLLRLRRLAMVAVADGRQAGRLIRRAKAPTSEKHRHDGQLRPSPLPPRAPPSPAPQGRSHAWTTRDGAPGPPGATVAPNAPAVLQEEQQKLQQQQQQRQQQQQWQQQQQQQQQHHHHHQEHQNQQEHQQQQEQLHQQQQEQLYQQEQQRKSHVSSRVQLLERLINLEQERVARNPFQQQAQRRRCQSQPSSPLAAPLAPRRPHPTAASQAAAPSAGWGGAGLQGERASRLDRVAAGAAYQEAARPHESHSRLRHWLEMERAALAGPGAGAGAGKWSGATAAAAAAHKPPKQQPQDAASQGTLAHEQGEADGRSGDAQRRASPVLPLPETPHARPLGRPRVSSGSTCERTGSSSNSSVCSHDDVQAAAAAAAPLPRRVPQQPAPSPVAAGVAVAAAYVHTSSAHACACRPCAADVRVRDLCPLCQHAIELVLRMHPCVGALVDDARRQLPAV